MPTLKTSRDWRDRETRLTRSLGQALSTSANGAAGHPCRTVSLTLHAAVSSLATQPVAVLFTMPGSAYEAIPCCDCYGEERDARTFPGGMPVVAHPPCRLWGGLRHLSTAPESEKALATWAVDVVRREGGVLEHPKGSTLWKAADLPYPFQGDVGDEFTLEVAQWHWGHKAEKLTWLYVCGCSPSAVPPIPHRNGRPRYVISTSARTGSQRPRVTHRERSFTPPAFAAWLCELARRTTPQRRAKRGR